MAKQFRCFVCFFVFVVVLIVPSFAVSDGFVGQPIPVGYTSYSDIIQYGFRYWDQSLNNNFCNYASSSADDTFIFLYKSGSDYFLGASSVNSFTIYNARSDSDHVWNNSFSNSSIAGGLSFDSSGYNSDFGLYFKEVRNSADLNSYVYYVPQFESLSDAFDAINAVINEPDVSYSSYVDIPAGYVAVVYAKNPSSSSPVGLRSNFSWSSSPNAPYWGNTGQSYKFFDSRPVFTDQTLFPLNGMSAIGWDKGRSTGFNGNTTYAVGEISFSSSFHWCVVYNPWVTFDSSATDPKYNSTIRLHATIAEAYLYPCSQLIGADGWESRSLDDWNNPYVGNAPVDDGGDWYWTEPSEIPGDPPVVVDPGAGGTNEVPPEVTNQNFLQRIIAILDNLLAEISGLFTFAFRAIAALVDAAASFFAVIGGLFTWLPVDVVTVIVSGFFLVVTIGVLKSFL